MKTNMKIMLTVLALGASAFLVSAQDNDDGPPRGGGPGGPGGPGGLGGPGGRHRPPPLPIVMAFDANHDGVIDADEIANAPAALKTLDKNGDGKLTMDELMPPPPQGMGGFPGDGQGPGDGPPPRRPHPNSGGNFDGPPGPPPGDQQ